MAAIASRVQASLAGAAQPKVSTKVGAACALRCALRPQPRCCPWLTSTHTHWQSQGFVRPSVPKTVKVMASSMRTSSSVAGAKAFSAKPTRGMRAASRRNAVMTKAKVSSQFGAGGGGKQPQCRGSALIWCRASLLYRRALQPVASDTMSLGIIELDGV